MARAGGRWRPGRVPLLVAVGAAVVLVGVVVLAAIGPSGRRHVTRAVGLPDPVDAPAAHCAWLAPGLSDARRVDLLLGSLDLSQKVGLVGLLGAGPTDFYEGYTAAVPEACLPSVTEQDGAEGVASGFTRRYGVPAAFGGSTLLPAPVADAAAFDPALAAAYGRVIGTEAADKGIDVALAPTVNIVRSPRWGRAYESLGEDPYLTASLAAAEVAGIQSRRVVAVVKHLAGYNQEQHRATRRDDEVMSERELHEIELPGFRAAIEDGGAGGVMCGLNLLDGTPDCQDGALLTGILRDQWHFTGFVRSDCGAVWSTASAMAAGLGQARCTPAYRPDQVTAALRAGTVTAAELDGVLRPVLATLMRFDLLASPQQFHPGPASTAADRSVALRVAEEGTVLVRNTGVLPLTARERVAVIGPLPGGPTASGGGALFVRSAPQPGMPAALSGVLDRRAVTARGIDIAAAVAAASQAEVAVVIVGDHDRETRDRATLSLGAAQDHLVQAVAAANPRTVVVVESGSAVLMPWLDRTAAVLETWYHGQMGGAALADVLSGRYDPSGKLPVTFPASDDQGPATTPATFGGIDGVVQDREGIDVGYRWYEVHHATPLFPFGFGLSYTRFRFSDLRVGPAAAGGVTVGVTVRNVGPRSGADVVQAYVGDPAPTGEPPRQLRGFARVSLGPGRAARVRMTITPGDLAAWTGAAGWRVAAGRYRIEVGDSSAPAGLPLTATVVQPARALGPDSGPGPGPAPTVTSLTRPGRDG